MKPGILRTREGRIAFGVSVGLHAAVVLGLCWAALSGDYIRLGGGEAGGGGGGGDGTPGGGGEGEEMAELHRPDSPDLGSKPSEDKGDSEGMEVRLIDAAPAPKVTRPATPRPEQRPPVAPEPTPKAVEKPREVEKPAVKEAPPKPKPIPEKKAAPEKKVVAEKKQPEPKPEPAKKQDREQTKKEMAEKAMKDKPRTKEKEVAAAQEVRKAPPVSRETPPEKPARKETLITPSMKKLADYPNREAGQKTVQKNAGGAITPDKARSLRGGPKAPGAANPTGSGTGKGPGSGSGSGGGSGSGTGGGVGSGNALFDGNGLPDFYGNQVVNRISKFFVLQPGQSSEETTVVSFRILRSGMLERISIRKSSGSAELDAVAKEAVETTRRVAPLPDDFEKNEIDVEVEFRFNP